ncbi:MAG: hypothetical protein ACJ8C4_21380 [Gemmataceae bacterium]
MAKAKSSKSKIDVKKFLLEKGEKVGLIVGGIGLTLLAILGVLQASHAASPGTISQNLKTATVAIDNRLRDTPDRPNKVTLAPGSQAMRKVGVNEFVTPYPLFEFNQGILDKRVNPILLPPEGGQAIYVIGGVGVYWIEGDPPMIAVREGVNPARNDMAGMINRLKSKNKAAPPGSVFQPPPGPAGGAPPGGAAPGGGPIPMGGGGGGGGAPKGPGGGGAGGGMPKPKLAETQISLKPLDSEDLAKANLAINLKPERMAIVRAVVPYKRQVQKYLNALRLENDAALVNDKSAPLYHGFDVERQVLDIDGKTVKEDWQELKYLDNYEQLYKITAAFEDEDPQFQDFKPQGAHRLYLRRPKLTHGSYSIPAMGELIKALDEVKKSAPVADLVGKAKQIAGKGDVFDEGDAPQASSGSPVPNQPALTTQPAAKGPPGKAGSSPKNNAMPCWILQLVDPDIQPGRYYKYRIRLKAANPNEGRTKEVSSPGLAEVKELVSEWYEIPQAVHSPPEEYLFANDDRRPAEDIYGEAAYDRTTLRFHRWMKSIRTQRDSAAEVPIAEWVIVDIVAKRGQFVHEERKAKIPLWSMVANNYILLPPNFTGRRIVVRENVTADFTPTKPVLLVDFEGGRGSYRLPNGTPINVTECAGQIMLVTEDGKTIVRNTAADRLIGDKKAREDAWEAWIRDIEIKTLQGQQSN